MFLTQPVLWGSEDGDWEDLLWAARTQEGRIDHRQAWEILERFNDVTRRLSREIDATLVDLARLLPKAPELFYDDDHFTVLGAQRLAGILAAELRRSAWFACLGDGSDIRTCRSARAIASDR